MNVIYIKATKSYLQLGETCFIVRQKPWKAELGEQAKFVLLLWQMVGG